MIRHHPNEAHALVLNRILDLPKDSPQSHAAYRAYQALRNGPMRLMLEKERRLLEAACLTEGITSIDADIVANMDAMAAAWFELDSRIGWVGVHPDATETAQEVPF